jgi:hypothetical protein
MKLTPLYTVIAFIVVIFAIGGISLTYKSYFDPKLEEVRRNTFLETPSYINGKIEDLVSLKRQYETEKDPAFKKALKEEIIHVSSTISNDKLPPNLQNFLKTLN